MPGIEAPRLPSDPASRNMEEEEEKEEISSPDSSLPASPPVDEKQRPIDDEEDSRRHSYEYARSRSPNAPRRRSLSRHNSAFNTLSRLRSRTASSAAPQEEHFTHSLSHTKTGADVLVDFDGKDDPYRPQNWPFRKKAITTVMYGMTTAGITFASSIYTSGTGLIANEFNVGTEVSTLGLAVVLFGFGLGPLLWAPLSEVYGRKPAVLIPYFLAAVFSFGTATAKDIQTVIITRFFSGFFGSAPITNTGGVLGDIWMPQQRGLAMVAYAIAVTGGPCVGPVVGGAICSSYLGWRWTEYLSGIIMMAILVIDVFVLDESFAPILLTHKARRLRHETGNWALHAEHEEWDVSIRELARKYLVRPIHLFCTPICFLIALYAGFVYALLYAALGAFPVAFQEVRGWGPVVGALPFMSMLIGILIGGGVNVLNQNYYTKKFIANGRRAVPEARLPPMMFGSIIFAAGLFIFAWTSDPKIHWIGQVISCALLGIGFFTIFQACLNYLVDTFQKYGASAIAANTFLRSMMAGAFPLFIVPELHTLGVDWGITVFACFSCLLLPVPYFFFIYGKRIRAKSPWSRVSV